MFGRDWKLAGYFKDNSKLLDISSPGIRNCQRGAFYATMAHFSRSDAPCLIALPTGSGKTALMMALCFGLEVSRALLITPATILRHQAYQKFSTLEGLTNAKAIPEDLSKPKIMEALHEFKEAEDWQACEDSDIVIATPNITSSQYRRVTDPPGEIFDTLFIDEAHHSPADSWTKLINSFRALGPRIILLTGTPYRRDQIQINADLIYDYPIDKAIDDDIFTPVNFVDVRSRSKNRDTSLANKCLSVRKQMTDEFKETPLILIKTDLIKHANELCDLYYKLGLTVKPIHSGLSEKENKSNLELLNAGNLDGIVAVGMVGEGLDITNLKIAVFHRNPQSLPYTIQLIGRLSRTGSRINKGQIVGYSNDFSRETFALYDSNSDWMKLIPYFEKKLINARIGKNISEPLGRGEDFLHNIDLRPFFTIGAYTFQEKPIAADISRVASWSKNSPTQQISVIHTSNFEGDTIILVTKLIESPDWINSMGFSRMYQKIFDLHLIFQYKNIVLEYSTNRQISSLLRFDLFRENLNLIERNSLNKVFEDSDGSYRVIGLKNSSGISYGNPSYKVLMGRETQYSIQNSDTKTFFAGHALMQLDRAARDSIFRGVAYKNSRIWDLKRDNIKAFRDWCLEISSKLIENKPRALPGLERLRSTEVITSFPENPLVIVHNTDLLHRSSKIELMDSSEDHTSDYLGEFKITDSEPSQIKFMIEGLDSEFSITINRAQGIEINKISGSEGSIIVDPFEGGSKRFSFTEYFEEFPPLILFSDGSSITDGEYSKPISTPELDSQNLKTSDWKGCDTHSEVEDTKIGKSIQKYIEEDYIPTNMHAQIVIHDHGTGEIADVIAIDTNKSHITFFHVKSLKTISKIPQKPGRRQSDLHEILAQAVTSAKLIKNLDLSKEILRRLNDIDTTKLIIGNEKDLEKFIANFSPILFSYEIIIVQPALRIGSLKADITNLLASTQDYINSAGGVFSVLGSAE